MSHPNIRNGDTFERVAPCASKGYPQPGDRYRVCDRWDSSTRLVAVGRVQGPHFASEFLDTLSNEAKWMRVDMIAAPSMLNVLTEELEGLLQ